MTALRAVPLALAGVVVGLSFGALAALEIIFLFGG